MTFNSAQKTASGSSVKTILGKTFSGGPVNACSVESRVLFKNSNLIKMTILYAPVTRRGSIPFSFQRSVLILRVNILENVIVLILKCHVFGLRPYL